MDDVTAFSVEDSYFGDELDPTSLEHILDTILDGLPEPERVSIQLTVLARFSYREASALLDADPDVTWSHDPKAIWRHRRRGLDLLRKTLTGTPWVRVFLADHIPTEGEEA